MRLTDICAVNIITSVLGKRGELKREEKLAEILKRRLTKKELKAINASVQNLDKRQIAQELNIDETRLNELVEQAAKKIKNESVHKEFYACHIKIEGTVKLD